MKFISSLPQSAPLLSMSPLLSKVTLPPTSKIEPSSLLKNIQPSAFLLVSVRSPFTLLLICVVKLSALSTTLTEPLILLPSELAIHKTLNSLSLLLMTSPLPVVTLMNSLATLPAKLRSDAFSQIVFAALRRLFSLLVMLLTTFDLLLSLPAVSVMLLSDSSAPFKVID